MKMLSVKRNIFVSIFTVMLLVYGVQGISYGQEDGTPTVTAGETNTSLKVSFTDLFYAFDEKAYQVQLRRKTPQGDWITRCDVISVGCGGGSALGGLPIIGGLFGGGCGGPWRLTVSFRNFIFTDLEPGTTYQVRYRDTNLRECHDNPPAPYPWSEIAEGTTHLVPPPRVEFVDATLATAVRKALDLDTQGGHIELLQIPEAELPKLTELRYASNDEGNPPNFRSKIVNLTSLEHATQLATLSLQDNNISDLSPLAQLTQLTTLDLSENNISDLSPLARLTQLTTLYLEDNQIIVITPLAQLTQLTKLSLGGFDGNEVSNISPLGQLTQLTELNLKDNNISDVTPLSQLTQLTELNLAENNISNVTPLTQLTLLTELDLANNNISDLTPLAQFTLLTELDLGFNNIIDITPLAQLINLKFLFLIGNNISDLTPLAQLSQRTTIFASYNPVNFKGMPSDIELMTVSTPQPLTEATLNGSSVTLTLLPSGAAYDTSIDNIRNALTLTGIDGVTVSDVIRVSDTELNVTFGFTGNLENTTTLTISLGAEAVSGYEGRALTGAIPVYPELGLTVSSSYPLSPATLNKSVATLTLSSGAFESIRSSISGALTISGITGITFRWTDVHYVSNTVVTIELTFKGSIDMDTVLTFTLGADAIRDYEGPALTAEIPVSASTEIELTGELVASSAFPLTKETLNGSIVKLTLKNHSYEGTRHDYPEPTIVVSGIPNVNIAEFRPYTYFYFLSSTEISVELSFSGNLENDVTLTFIVPPRVIKDYNGPPLAAALPVTVKTGQQVLVPESQRPSMYWINTDTDKIESLEPFDAVTQEVVSLTLDAAGGKIYWAEQGSSRGTIKRANLDGTNVEVLTTEPITASSLAVDTADNKLYWIDSTQGKIHSADLNGENIRTITQTDNDIMYIAVDAAGGKLYWADQFSIWRVNLDGTNSEKVLTISRAYTYIKGIAVADGKIYWTEQPAWSHEGNIHRANLNGTNIETLATPLGTPTGIAVDTVGSKVYWANSYGGIQRMDINGGEIENVVYGIAAPGGFALGAVSTEPTTPTTPETPSETPADTDTVVSISSSSVASPAVGEQLEVRLNIADGENVAGYQATVQFDTTALRYVSGANGDYLAAGAFFVEPKVEGNLVKLNAASLAGESEGDGTLATLTFEVVAVKASTLALSDVLLTDSAGSTSVPNIENAGITGPNGDINGDGTVNIADLVLVASNLDQIGQNDADVNGDGVVDTADLLLVAGMLGTSATAPSLYAKDLPMLTAADIRLWLSQAEQLNITDATSLRGILFLQQLLTGLTPKETTLLPNFPNPFNPETWIPYHLAKDTDVTLHIYAVNGTLVRSLTLGHQAAGMYQTRSQAAHWDGKNEFGEKVASGVYFYTLTAGDFTATRKMLIRK